MSIRSIRQWTVTVFALFAVVGFAGTATASHHEEGEHGDNPCAENPCGDNPCGDNPCGDNPCGDNPCDEHGDGKKPR